MESVKHIRNTGITENSSLLEPLTSIFGEDSNEDVTSIQIQVIEEQYEQTVQGNKFKKEKPEFDKMYVFMLFPNIVGELVQGPTGNYFFDALYLAYTCHGELVLSPSDIWLAILGSFSEYVNDNAEWLRSRIVSHQDKKDLVIYIDENDTRFEDMYSEDYRWDIITEEFSNLIKESTLGEIQSIVQCDFTCSSQIERIVSEVSLMNTCKKYFNYIKAVKGCGIQIVHFLGKRQDWVNLQNKIKCLEQYSLKKTNFDKWINGLMYITNNLLITYDGQPNTEFWNSIIDKQMGTGEKRVPSGKRLYDTYVISGWCLDFFYGLKRQIYSVNGVQVEGTELKDILALHWSAPVIVEYQRNKLRIGLNFVGGFTGVLTKNYAFRPQVAFGVAKRDITQEEEETVKRRFK